MLDSFLSQEWVQETKIKIFKRATPTATRASHCSNCDDNDACFKCKKMWCENCPTLYDCSGGCDRNKFACGDCDHASQLPGCGDTCFFCDDCLEASKCMSCANLLCAKHGHVVSCTVCKKKYCPPHLGTIIHLTFTLMLLGAFRPEFPSMQVLQWRMPHSPHLTSRSCTLQKEVLQRPQESNLSKRYIRRITKCPLFIR